MRTKMLLLAVPAALAVLLGVNAYLSSADKDTKKDEQMVVHNVFFSLKESTPANRQKLVDSCKKHLTKHEGEVFFSAGPLVEELKRDVNDRDFDVALMIVFKNMAAHDKYQDHKRHLEFIKEGKETWKKVRVFDNYATK